MPSVPCGKGGRGGAFFDGRKRLFPCIVLIRCVLNREKHEFFTRTFNVMDFFGHKAGPVYAFLPLLGAICRSSEMGI